MSNRNSPRVSVITPTYNRADFICEAVDSVLGQTFDDFELLIVDDGSTDNTREVLGERLDDPRVSYTLQENQGQSVARNNALARATGEYVCFLDSDNYWPLDKLAHQIEVFESNPEVDVVYGDTITIDEDGHELSRKNMKRYSGHIAGRMLRDNCVSMNTAMARRKCFEELGGMSGTRRVADDYDLWLRFSARFRFLYTPEYWAYYRVMENQISSDKQRRFDTNEAIIRDFREQFPDAVSQKEFDSGFAMFHIRKARYLASAGRKREAFKELLKAMHYRPFAKPVWKAMVAVAVR